MDEDTRAFNEIMAAFGLPKKSAEEQVARKKAIEAATLRAIDIPFQVMNAAFKGFEVAGAMVEQGNPNSVTDAGVGALALHTCMEGAWLNVKINAAEMKNHPQVEEMLEAGRELFKRAEETKNAILDRVYKKIG